MEHEGNELDYLEGTVSSLVYRNEENGYCVLRLDSDDAEEEVTVVGIMPQVHPGEFLALHGKWEQHSNYGMQLRALVVERRMPEGRAAIFRYLASGALYGVGAITARRLVDAFGEDTFRIIEEEPDRLMEIQGITKKRAVSISNTLKEQLSMGHLLDFLSLHGLPAQIAIPLYRLYSDKALSLLKENPYLLAKDGVGSDFPTADKLAASLGFSPDHTLRMEAGLLFELQFNSDNGHVFLPREKLLKATAGLLGTPEEALSEVLDTLAQSGQIICEDIASQDACYLTKLYDSECLVAEKLRAMAERELYSPVDLDALIAAMEQRQGITYAPLQREAIATASTHQVMLLTGGPGTGKTTILRGVLSLFDHMGLDTVLTAPTGRAAKRLSDSCGGENASTIHRLLETKQDSTGTGLSFAKNENSLLEADAIIVDESSMVDLSLMAALLSALREDCRLILVGDPHQLPSVGAGNLLSDLLRSKVIPTLTLTEIFRQAASSAIVQSAHTVNSGSLPPLSNRMDSDFFFLRRTDPSTALSTIVELCRDRLPGKMGILPSQIQVLSPTKKGGAGTVALNSALQEALNPQTMKKGEKQFGNITFREGDKVMQIKNNYDIMWENRSLREVGMGIFNGDVGKILNVDPQNSVLTIDFDGRLAEYSPDLFHQLEPAYAMTVHKSQGSEYPAVILCALDAASMLLTRAVLYTAITRAKDMLIVVGDENVLAHMAKNDRPTRRYSGLRARLTEGR